MKSPFGLKSGKKKSTPLGLSVMGDFGAYVRVVLPTGTGAKAPCQAGLLFEGGSDNSYYVMLE